MHAAVIGAGWAGCAAAVTLARLGHQVTVFETAEQAGGRARRVTRAGLPLDNGQHLLLGAYAQTLNVMAAVSGGAGEADLSRLPMTIEPLAPVASALRLRAKHLPAPFGLLAGLLRARGLSLRDRAAVVAWFARLKRRDFRCGPDTTVAELLAEGPAAAARGLWAPLCLAALNTPVERASAQVFANVLRAAFNGRAQASDFLLASTDLTALFPDAALRYVMAHGGTAALRTHARMVGVDDRGVAVVARGTECRFDAAVIAVGPHQLDAAITRDPVFTSACTAAEGLDYEPITTIWLGYAACTALPAPIARLDDAPGQWVVDRPDIVARAVDDASRPPLEQLVAIVISASGPHDAMQPAELASACDAQLRRLAPRWPKSVWSQSIAERRATYACTPRRPRPPSALPHPRVALAGDWIDAEFPATLEAAVRTGVSAAMALDAASS